eukprot:1158936-Pelagomonas_calceolata.AAC.2
MQHKPAAGKHSKCADFGEPQRKLAGPFSVPGIQFKNRSQAYVLATHLQHCCQPGHGKGCQRQSGIKDILTQEEAH